MGKPTDNGAITRKDIERFKSAFNSNQASRIAMNAVTRGNLQEIAINRDVLNDVNFCFTHEVETGSITDQKRSGTCWMFAELNWLRTFTQKKMNIKDIEFSENYLMFWDKFEKANYWLEQIITLRDKPLDDRKIHFLLHNPVPDGGEWHMIVNLIQKYGLVPMSVMPNTWNRENSRFVNEILGYKLREYAAKIRSLHARGKPEDQIRTQKNRMIEEIHRILCTFMGVPPETFNWSYRDKDNAYFQDTGITPREFYDKYVGVNLDECYTLVSCPANEFNKVYTIEFFNNMVGGRDWHWLNVPVQELKKIALKMLKKGDAALYGCDVVQFSHSKEGLMHHELYDFDLIFQTRLGMDKKERLEYGHSVLTHSMVLTGVELVDKKPIRWKVENSWGTEVGKKGFFVMSDEWFDEYTYDLIVPKEYMPKKLLELFEQAPIQLPPWHPMA